MKRTIARFLPGVALAAALTGCSSMYYGAMEKVGVHKRDLMTSRITDARNAQEATKEQFQTALQHFTEVMNFKGGALEDKYNKLNAEFERSEKKANDLKARVASVADVSEALFKEWKGEIKQFTNPTLKKSSEAQYKQTRAQYDSLIKAMKDSVKKTDPVVQAFREQVLFLKHNLNAQAIASIQGEAVTISKDVSALIQSMEASIAEADRFLATLAKP
jgi:predicted  nucleic acid-binding Zn-ribbon protein